MRFFVRELARWDALEPAARRYLAYVALLTTGFAAPQLFFNLAVLAQGYGREILGLLNTVALGTAAALSIPLWLGINRIGLRRALITSAVLHCVAALLFAFGEGRAWLLANAALTGVASVLFQLAAAPFMMRHSDATTRDHLFSASSALAIGVSGVATLAAGPLPGLLGGMIGAGPESAAAYRACYAISAVLVGLAVVPLLNAGGRTLNAEPNAGGRTLNAEQNAEGRTLNAEGRTLNAERAVFRTPMLTGDATAFQTRLRRTTGTALNDAIFSVQRSAFSVLKSLPKALLLPPLLVSSGAALLIPYLNLFFAERHGVGNVALGVIFAGFDIATGVALLGAPAISRRIGKMPAVVLTRALALPFTLLVGFAPGLALATGAALARVVLFNMAAPLYDAAALERVPDETRPLVVGLLGAAYSAGYLAGPLVSVWVQERYGFGPLFVATTALYALSVVAVWWFFVRRAG